MQTEATWEGLLGVFTQPQKGGLVPGPRAVLGCEWLTVREAARRARCGVKTIYREVAAKRLKAARIGGRRELRLRPQWVDEWLESRATVH